ncbi:hypothetical protein F4775DRAFT_607202 [Biscogniauxia sp. FL1348]|nr:hypothetical protein F4775DRAFT_607202 [Biscogniauxia sp. FL1348]
MENNGIAYSQIAEEVTQQPKGPGKPDELSHSDPVTATPSPNSHHPSDETASSNNSEPSPEKPASNNNKMPAKPKRVVRFAESVTGDDSAATNAPKTPITRSYKSMTTTNTTTPSPTTGRKRGRPAADQITTPRKRGRPRKNPVPVPVPTPAAAPIPTASSAGNNNNGGEENETTTTTMGSLVREAFVVHALAARDGPLSIPRDLALRIHALLAPGLPPPRGDVYVQADLAGRIRALFGGGEGM